MRSVSIQPGSNAFTRIPAHAVSTDSDWVSEMSAAFAAP